ncbi:MAG: porin [Gammaproteobacteria bacterium]
MNINNLHRHTVVAAILFSMSHTASAADEALLQVLLANKLITQKQYDAIVAAQSKSAEKQPAPTATATPAATADKPVPKSEDGLLDVLLANGVITQQQFAALQLKNADDKAKKVASEEAKVTLKDGLKIKSASGDFSAQIGAYAQLDSAWYGDGPTDFSDGTEMRRTRLSVNGTVFRDWDYKVEADFAGTTQATGTTNNVTVTDAYLRYTGWKPFAFTAGSFKIPFSLEAVSSAKYTTFMERGLPFAFLNLRSLGGMISANGDNWTGAVGFFGDTVTSQNVDDEGRGGAARVTWAPFFQKDKVLHFGLAGQYRIPADNPAGNRRESVRFRSKPESNIITDNLTQTGTLTAAGKTFGRSSGRLVDTGDIPGNVEDYTLFGAEFAAVYGAASLQGEYIRADVNRDIGGDLAFDGYYVYGSWFLTGESRNYKADKGVFDIVQPNSSFRLHGGGWGAWEIALRFSSLDLNDKTVAGGETQDVTVGLNWYPNAYMRLMANYVNVLDVDGGAHNNEDLDAIQLRAQVAY